MILMVEDNKAKTEMQFSKDRSDNAGRRQQNDTRYMVWYGTESRSRGEKKKKRISQFELTRNNGYMDVNEKEPT